MFLDTFITIREKSSSTVNLSQSAKQTADPFRCLALMSIHDETPRTNVPALADIGAVPFVGAKGDKVTFTEYSKGNRMCHVLAAMRGI